MRLFCLFLLIAPAFAPSALAQENPGGKPPVPVAVDQGETVDNAVADRRVRRLSDELRSPFCPGKTIMTCTSSQAYTLRQEIREMIMAGQTDDEVAANLALRYGDDIRNPPQPWYTALVPFLPFVAGGILVLLVFRHWRRGARAADDPEPTDATAEDGEALAKLRARVAAYDEE